MDWKETLYEVEQASIVTYGDYMTAKYEENAPFEELELERVRQFCRALACCANIIKANSPQEYYMIRLHQFIWHFAIEADCELDYEKLFADCDQFNLNNYKFYKGEVLITDDWQDSTFYLPEWLFKDGEAISKIQEQLLTTYKV